MENQKFCRNCGAAIDISANKPEPKKSKKTKLIVIFAIIIIVLISIAAIFIVFTNVNKDKYTGVYSGISEKNESVNLIIQENDIAVYVEADSRFCYGNWKKTDTDNMLKLDIPGISDSELSAIWEDDDNVAVESNSSKWSTDYLKRNPNTNDVVSKLPVKDAISFAKKAPTTEQVKSIFQSHKLEAGDTKNYKVQSDNSTKAVYGSSNVANNDIYAIFYDCPEANNYAKLFNIYISDAGSKYNLDYLLRIKDFDIFRCKAKDAYADYGRNNQIIVACGNTLFSCIYTDAKASEVDAIVKDLGYGIP